MIVKKIYYITGVVATAATLLTGCDPADVGSFATKTECEPGPIVFIIPDNSGSTEAQRVPGGTYETSMMTALKAAAEACADVYSAPADANSIGHGKWVIDGTTFRQTIGGNEEFGAAARAKAAEKLRPKVRRELRLGQPDGTDLLGSAQRVKLAIDSLQDQGQRPIKVLWLTDGAVNLRGFSMYHAPLHTPDLRQRFVRRLAAAGELPDFGGKVEFYMGGLGINIPARDQAQDIIATWKLLVPAMNAHLKSIDATLRYP